MSDNASPEQKMPALACNFGVVPAAQRPSYRHLLQRLRGAVEERRELPEGYAFRLSSTAITARKVSEWMRMEHRCCPFPP